MGSCTQSAQSTLEKLTHGAWKIDDNVRVRKKKLKKVGGLNYTGRLTGRRTEKYM